MSEDKKYSIDEANAYFAINFNNNIWKLLDKKDRTDEDNNEMINLAHASLLHWKNRSDCQSCNLQRGEYMIALAYIHSGRQEPALYHAIRCLNITSEKIDEMKDFDIAYASLIMSGALSLFNNIDGANAYLQDAKKFGENIRDEEDKKIFMGDLSSVPWNKSKV